MTVTEKNHSKCSVFTFGFETCIKTISALIHRLINEVLLVALYVSTATLNWMRCGMRSQCRLISASDTWSERRKPKISRQAILRRLTNWRFIIIIFLFFYYYYYVAHSKKSRWNILDFKMFPWILLRDPPIREVRCIVSFDKTAIQNHVTQTVNSPEYYIARLCRGQRDIHWNVVVKTSMWE